MNKTFDRYAGIIFLAIGAIFMFESQKISESVYGGNVSPNVFPFGLGFLLTLLSIRLIYETFRAKEASKDNQKLEYKKFFIILVSAIAYALLLEPLGYVITTFLFLLVGFQVMEKGQFWKSLIIALIVSVGVYYVYVEVMAGTLPGFPQWLTMSGV